jgi:hypothetical protein
MLSSRSARHRGKTGSSLFCGIVLLFSQQPPKRLSVDSEHSEPVPVSFERIRRGDVMDVAPRWSIDSLSGALQPLGLELERTKKIIDVFVIDSVQYPSPN